MAVEAKGFKVLSCWESGTEAGESGTTMQQNDKKNSEKKREELKMTVDVEPKNMFKVININKEMREQLLNLQRKQLNFKSTDSRF